MLAAEFAAERTMRRNGLCGDGNCAETDEIGGSRVIRASKRPILETGCSSAGRPFRRFDGLSVAPAASKTSLPLAWRSPMQEGLMCTWLNLFAATPPAPGLTDGGSDFRGNEPTRNTASRPQPSWR